jgi:acyl-homoserine lactone acylase PvdQ
VTTDYRLITLPKVVTDLLMGSDDPRLIRPSAASERQVEAWLRALAAWDRDDDDTIAEIARRFLAQRWRWERGRLTDGR